MTVVVELCGEGKFVLPLDWISTNEPPVDKINRLIQSYQPTVDSGEFVMKVDKIWKLTNVVRVRLAPRYSHSQRQSTFLKCVNMCSYSPPCQGVSHMKKMTTFCFLRKVQFCFLCKSLENTVVPFQKKSFFDGTEKIDLMWAKQAP